VTPPGASAIPVRLQGPGQSRSLDHDVFIDLEADTLRISPSPVSPEGIVLPLAELRGAHVHEDALTVWLINGSAVTVSGSPHLDGLRNRLEAAVCAFPAQLLSLRGFGSERSAPGSDHDQWFDALLAARRLAEESRTVETQRRAFDAARLTRHAQLTRESWAAARFSDAPDRRALEAELEELAAPYSAALRQLEHAALRLRQAPAELQFETWRRWAKIVQRAFRAADDVWTLTIPVLADSRGAKGSFWRRILRRGGSKPVR
jgi:hypothetical protein